jgi:hypothetical protein
VDCVILRNLKLSKESPKPKISWKPFTITKLARLGWFLYFNFLFPIPVLLISFCLPILQMQRCMMCGAHWIVEKL